MANGVHKITEDFEKALCKYTCAPYAVCIDNASNAMFLALEYINIKGKEITIPSHTYPSVPAEIIRAGGKVKFKNSPTLLKGEYLLEGTNVYDSALRFTWNMFRENCFQILSFTGPFKRMKLSKAGAILTDDIKFVEWAKRRRFSGRSECSYFDEENFELGYNCYLMPELAARGLLLISEFYNYDGSPKLNEDIELPYPDLSKHKIYTES